MTATPRGNAGDAGQQCFKLYGLATENWTKNIYTGKYLHFNIHACMHVIS